MYLEYANHLFICLQIRENITYECYAIMQIAIFGKLTLQYWLCNASVGINKYALIT